MRQIDLPACPGRFVQAWVSLLLLILLVFPAPVNAQPVPQLPEPPVIPGETSDADAQAAADCRRANCQYLPHIRGGSQPASWFTWDRASAISLYRSLYQPGEKAAHGWDGSVKACRPGETAAPFRDAMLKRINYFRQAAGVPALDGLNGTYNRKAQAAALMISRNQQLSHDPPTSWECYSSEGKEGAGNSNLYINVFGPEAVSGYMRDPGNHNSFVGHRRWLLFPNTREMGIGDVPPADGYGSANALWVFDSNAAKSRPATRNPFVAWPPPGYIPYQVVYPFWSFSYPGADFSRASVSLSRGSSSVPITRQEPKTGYGDNTLVWKINRMEDHEAWPEPSSPTGYTVTIRGVRIDGQSRDFTYPVIIFSP